jgi:hypothetical protein
MERSVEVEVVLLRAKPSAALDHSPSGVFAALSAGPSSSSSRAATASATPSTSTASRRGCPGCAGRRRRAGAGELLGDSVGELPQRAVEEGGGELFATNFQQERRCHGVGVGIRSPLFRRCFARGPRSREVGGWFLSKGHLKVERSVRPRRQSPPPSLRDERPPTLSVPSAVASRRAPAHVPSPRPHRRGATSASAHVHSPRPHRRGATSAPAHVLPARPTRGDSPGAPEVRTSGAGRLGDCPGAVAPVGRAGRTWAGALVASRR